MASCVRLCVYRTQKLFYVYSSVRPSVCVLEGQKGEKSTSIKNSQRKSRLYWMERGRERL
jgi:hypothetical protein